MNDMIWEMESCMLTFIKTDSNISLGMKMIMMKWINYWMLLEEVEMEIDVYQL